MDETRLIISYVARGIEAMGVAIIAVGAVLAIGRFLFGKPAGPADAYTSLRQDIGKAILLGLEVLVAADIIATVVTEPTLERVFTLAVIVLIRTFLSLSLQVEIEGRFPWQGRKPTDR